MAALAFFFSGCAAHLPGDALNPGFEEVQGGQIASWRYPAAAPGLRVFADSSAARSGRYALAVHKERTDIAYVAITNSTTVAAGLEQVTVEAEFKGTLAHGSRASLWIRVEDSNGSILGLANEGTDGVPGSDGWYPTRVALKAGAPGPVTVYFGVLLQGTGRLWVDNYSIRINGAATWEQVPAGDGPAAARDTAFGHGSALDAQLVEARSHTVEKAGEVWAFLKYYHPAFYLGEKNCDAEWFRLLHQVSAHPESEGDLVIERWVAALGSLPDRKDSCAQSRNARPAGFGRLFRPGFLTASLREQLKAVAAAYPGVASQYTVGLDPSVQTALQKNERPYRELAYPDAGVRLLALFRLWGFFQYFSPNLDLATRWDEVPAQFVRPMLQSRNAAGYRSVLAEVIARMNDGHAGLTDYHGVLDSMEAFRTRGSVPDSSVTTYTVDQIIQSNDPKYYAPPIAHALTQKKKLPPAIARDVFGDNLPSYYDDPKTQSVYNHFAQRVEDDQMDYPPDDGDDEQSDHGDDGDDGRSEAARAERRYLAAKRRLEKANARKGVGNSRHFMNLTVASALAGSRARVAEGSRVQLNIHSAGSGPGTLDPRDTQALAAMPPPAAHDSALQQA
ncbi:MAG: hypothetical protein EOO11_17155, partial [Chitinophagaceae bacterium]